MTVPHVTCVMTAFNYERYVTAALDSVLAQDYPGDRLDVVVVSDGSTDGTADAVRALQARAGGRVLLVEQENAGLAAATATAMQHATGELIAICDADDEWLPGKVAAQVEILSARPEVSLVYGDMQVIDEHGAVVDRSFFRRIGVERPEGHVLDRIVRANCVTNSTLMWRAAQVIPPPARSPFADYWVAAHAAAAGELAVIARPLANYRMHSSNMGFGTTGVGQVGVIMREVRGRRLILISLFSVVPLDALLRAVQELEARAMWIRDGGGLDERYGVDDADRDRAEAELERGRNEPDADDALRAFALARLLDPCNRLARIAMDAALAARSQPRTEVTVASAAELIAKPELVVAYCQTVGGSAAATLVIIDDRDDLDATGRLLRDALLSVGVDPDECPDLMLVPAAEDLTAFGPRAVLTQMPELAFARGLEMFAAAGS